MRSLVFDFDDAVFLRDSYAAKGLHDRRRLRRFAATIRACDAVAAGNAFLARNAARWTSPGRIYVVPTCVDPALYPTAVRPSPGRRRPARLGRLVQHAARSGSRPADAGGTGRPPAGRTLKAHLRPLFAL